MQSSPVVALVGEDVFSQLQALRGVVESLPAGTQRVDVDGEVAELAEVLDELRSFSMFSPYKMVVVRNGDAFLTRFREALEDYLGGPSDSATLVLRLGSLPKTQRIYKAIAKVGKIEETAAPKKPGEVAAWATRHAKSAHGLTLAGDAARMLADLVGSDLGRIDNELAKLALLHADGRIDTGRIAGSVAFQRDQAMWDMTNAISTGKVEEAVRRWRRLVQMDSSTEFRAVTWLAIWLENVTKALAMLERGMAPGTICQQLRIWPVDIQRPFMETARKMGKSGVKRAVELLAEVDFRSKTGRGEMVRNVEAFLVGVGGVGGVRGR